MGKKKKGFQCTVEQDNLPEDTSFMSDCDSFQVVKSPVSPPITSFSASEEALPEARSKLAGLSSNHEEIKRKLKDMQRRIQDKVKIRDSQIKQTVDKIFQNEKIDKNVSDTVKIIEEKDGEIGDLRKELTSLKNEEEKIKKNIKIQQKLVKTLEGLKNKREKALIKKEKKSSDFLEMLPSNLKHSFASQASTPVNNVLIKLHRIYVSSGVEGEELTDYDKYIQDIAINGLEEFLLKETGDNQLAAAVFDFCARKETSTAQVDSLNTRFLE